jgi:hypothetical protein
MSMQRVWALGFALAAALAATTALCQADDPKTTPPSQTEKVNAAKKDQALADVADAFRMAEAGRRTSTPEALIAAARILIEVGGVKKLEGVQPVTSKADATEKPKGGEPVKDVGQVVSFSDEVTSLLDEAGKLNASNDPHVTALIDRVRERVKEKEEVKTRGSFAGPAQMPGGVAVGDTNTYTFGFRGGLPARLVLTSTNGVPLQLEVYNDANVLVGGGTRRGTVEVEWVPAFNRNFRVYVTNRGGRFANYNLYKN